jgi:hypothetical protein
VSLFGLILFPLISLSQSNFSGYYRFESGILTSENGDFLFNRNILQPEFRHQTSDYSFNLALQFRQNVANGDNLKPEIRLREAFFEIRREKFDLRIGQQMIVWGRADAAQIHDILTPMDLSEFLTQDFTDLRLGVTAMNFTYYRQNNNFQLIVIPVFEPSSLAEPGSRWSLYPTDNVTYTETQYPSVSFGSTQFALRWNNRTNLNLDLDVSIYSGFNPNPALSKTVTTFTPSPVLEVSQRYYRNTALFIGTEFRPSQNLILTSEQALWLNTKFDDFPQSLRSAPNGTTIDFETFLRTQNSQFLAESPYLQSLWGIRFPFISGNLSLQYTLEYILEHSASMLQNQIHHTGSVLYTRVSGDERWNFRLLSRYHLGGNDAWINPDVTFAGIDGVRFSTGANFFAGDEPDPFYGHLTFYNFRNNSFAYLKLTAFW